MFYKLSNQREHALGNEYDFDDDNYLLITKVQA